MFTIIVGIFLVLHGLVHLLYAGQSGRFFELRPGTIRPDNSWLFSNFLGDATNPQPSLHSISIGCPGLYCRGSGAAFSTGVVASYGDEFVSAFCCDFHLFLGWQVSSAGRPGWGWLINRPSDSGGCFPEIASLGLPHAATDRGTSPKGFDIFSIGKESECRQEAIRVTS
jgi:hypothetical protein